MQQYPRAVDWTTCRDEHERRLWAAYETIERMINHTLDAICTLQLQVDTCPDIRDINAAQHLLTLSIERLARERPLKQRAYERLAAYRDIPIVEQCLAPRKLPRVLEIEILQYLYPSVVSHKSRG